MNRNTLCILILVFCQTIVQAQQKIGLESLVPPAPNAAELGKYGTYPVGYVTGIPDISFPLYEVASGSLQLPITLSYHASGVQVNQKSTDVGLNWSIMAGGTISRTVYGAADNSAYGYFNYTPPTYQTLFNHTNYYTMQGYSNPGYDLEPDLFAYNVGGKSGKFIYSKTQNFVTIPFDPIKITKSGVGATVLFQIVDDNGVTYSFNQSGTTNSNITSSHFNRNSVTTSSWYLTSMISADLTDTISFEYESIYTDDPMNQQAYAIGKEISLYGGSPSTQVVTGDTEFQGSGGYENIPGMNGYSELLVKKIKFKNGYILFNRITGRKDISPVSKMLDEMVVYNMRNEVVKKIEFSHDYYVASSFMNDWWHHRLKLTGFAESTDASAKKKYFFDYDATTFPPYGSYNIDYWGFYNGASNWTLIPTTTVYARQINSISFANGETYNNDFNNPNQSWTVGSANRQPSATIMKAGILTKITYPTSGYTLFDFEPHQYLSSEYVKQPVSKSHTSNGIDKFTKNTSSHSFSFPEIGPASVNDGNVYAQLTINFSVSNMGNTESGDTQVVTLKNVTEGQVLKTWKHEGDLMTAYSVHEELSLGNGMVYELKHEIYGSNLVTIETYVNWIENKDEHPVKIGGGLRIKSLKSYASNGTLAFEDNYTYGATENGLGVKLFDERTFYGNYEDVVSAYYTSVSPSGGMCGLNGTYWKRKFLGISKYNSLNYQGSPILYSTVTKYSGNIDSNTGKTVYNYNIIFDPINFPNEFINSANYGSINNAWNQAELLAETAYKKTGTTYSEVSKSLHEYTTFNPSSENAIAFKQHKQFVKLSDCGTYTEGPETSNGKYGQGFYTMYQYPIKTGISKRTKQTSIVYDPDNISNAVTTITTYQYQNAANRYMTETSVTDSDGKSTITRVKYPQDVTGSVVNAMITKNILTPNMEEKTYSSLSGTETLLSAIQNVYKQVGNLIVRDTIKASTGSLALEPRIIFNQYDAGGNIIMQQKANDVKQSYIWGYRGSLPIAEVKNASSTDIAYTSFESSAPGLWTINSSARVTASKFTGKLSYALSGGLLTKSGLDYAKSYIVSLWAQAGASLSVNGTAPTAGITLNGWTYYERTISGNTSITISGTGTIDEVRLYPTKAQMTTYTYDPLIGATSMIDVNNKPLFYEYDTMGRLKWAKDHNGHIVKAYEYHYKGN